MNIPLRFHVRRIAPLWMGTLVLSGSLLAEGMNFQQAFDLLERQNPDLEEAMQRTEVALAIQAEAKAAYLPQLGVNASYIGSDHPIQVFGALLNQSAFSPHLDFNHVPTTDDLNVQGRLSYPVFTSGRRRADFQSAQSDARATKWNQEALGNRLKLFVTETMLDIDRSQSMKQAARQALESMESNLAYTRKRHAAGKALHQDVLDMEVQLAEARIILLRAQHLEDLSMASLKRLLAWPEDRTLVLADSLTPLFLPMQATEMERPEVMAARAQSRAADHARTSAQAANRPSVHVFGSYDTHHGWDTGRSLGSWTAGVAMQWDLWTGGRHRAKRDAAEARMAASQSRLQSTRMQVRFEIQKARLEHAEADLKSTWTTDAVQHAEESLRLTRARYEEGLALAHQLLDAETTLTQTRMERIHAATEAKKSIARLRHALGLPLLENQPASHPSPHS